jgi:hypothetical protein
LELRGLGVIPEDGGGRSPEYLRLQVFMEIRIFLGWGWGSTSKTIAMRM